MIELTQAHTDYHHEKLMDLVRHVHYELGTLHAQQKQLFDLVQSRQELPIATEVTVTAVSAEAEPLGPGDMTIPNYVEV